VVMEGRPSWRICDDIQLSSCIPLAMLRHIVYPPSSLSVIGRKRPLITMHVESQMPSGLHKAWPAWIRIQSRDASIWSTKNPLSEMETRGPERVNLTKWRQEGHGPLRQCQDDDGVFLQQPFQSGVWEVSHASIRLRHDVDVRGSVIQQCC